MTKNFLQHCVVIFYITVLLSGFCYTLFRIPLPGMPRLFWKWSYGTMAPYQTYRTFNEELVAEGLKDGHWDEISLKPYQPFIRGEKAMRSYLVSFRYQDGTDWQQKYAEFGQKILRLERQQGSNWEQIRLKLEKWPMSPAGYEYLRLKPFIKITHL